MPATLTQITGSIYDSLGNLVTSGFLYITLPQDMISVDGTKIVPVPIVIDLSLTAGVVDTSVYATVGATPAGLAYRVEFDPTPDDITKPMYQKDGYWRNYWVVPNTATVTIASFLPTLRGAVTLSTAGTPGAVGPVGPVGAMGATGPTPTGVVKADGTVAFTADQSMGTHKITNVVDPASAQDAATRAYVLATNRVIQVVNTQTGAVATGSTVIPLDDTIPQITEGNEYMTLAITPTSATNKLKIEVVGHWAHTVSNTFVTAALFQDSTASALAAATQASTLASGNAELTFTYWMTSGTTSVTTFRVRAGGGDAGTTTFNGRIGGRVFGGIMASSITITEIKP
jgi:hypothetical protein